MQAILRATPGPRWVSVALMGVGIMGCSSEQSAARVTAPAFVEVPYASVAAAETWDKLSFDMTMEVSALGTRYKAPTRSMSMRVAREREPGRGWKTVIDLPYPPADRPGAQRAGAPARMEAYDDGQRTLVDAQGRALPAKQAAPNWPAVKKVAGARSYTEVPGIAGPSTPLPSAGKYGAGRAWADFLLVGPGTKGRLLGAVKTGATKSAGQSRVQFSSSFSGVETEVVVDTAAGRVEEIRGTLSDGSRNVAKNFFVQLSSGAGHLSRTEHVRFNKAGAQIERVVVTYSNVKTLQAASGGES